MEGGGTRRARPEFQGAAITQRRQSSPVKVCNVTPLPGLGLHGALAQRKLAGLGRQAITAVIKLVNFPKLVASSPWAADDQVLTLADATAKVAPATGADNQLWKIDQLDDGSYRLASKAGKLALAAAVNLQPGNGVTLQTFTGDDCQRWVIAAP